jgi:hypothetical protein
MNKVLVGSFATSHDATTVRQCLLDAGVPASAIAVVRGGDIPTPHVSTKREDYEPGLAGFIARMFSGAVLEDPRARAYHEAAHQGRVVVAVRAGGKEAAVRAILGRSGPVDEHVDDGRIVGTGSPPVGADSSATGDATSAVIQNPGPDVNVLPNAPTGWPRAGKGAPATTGSPGHDPMRPQGLLNDTAGLGAPPPHARTPLQPGDQRPAIGATPPQRLPARGHAASTSSLGGITATEGVAAGTKFHGDPLLDRVKARDAHGESGERYATGDAEPHRADAPEAAGASARDGRGQ